MTVPLLPFNYLGTWGAPYHGLIKGGQISLPNATQRAYPQPGSGDTWLVKFAGVPPVSRTPEQQSSDYANGYEWRNYAIIAGNAYQLHGRNIGTPWLHKDESGRVWSVSVSHSAGNAVNLTLTEFGVIRLEELPAEEIPRLVILPDMGLTTVSEIQLLDVHPSGTEAVFMASQGTAKALFKISITNLSAVATVLKSLNDMVIDHSIAEQETVVPEQTVRTPSYMRGKYDEIVNGEPAGGFIEFSDSPLPDIYDFAGPADVNFVTSGGVFGGRFMSFNYQTGSETREKTDGTETIIWANYDAAGNLHYYSALYTLHDYEKIEKTGSYSGGWYIYCDSSASDPGAITGSMSGSIQLAVRTKTTKTQTYTYQLRRDGAAVDEYQITLTDYKVEGTDRVVSGATPSVGTWEDIVVYDSGGGATLTPVDITSRTDDFEGEPIGADLPINYGGTYYLPNGDREYEPLASGLPGFEIIQSTNKLAHMVTEYNYKPGYLIGHHVGPDSRDEIRHAAADLSAIYATYQPYTGEIVREQAQSVSFV